MKPAIEARALAACRDLVACRTEVERLSHLIGNALSACHAAWFYVQETKNFGLDFDMNAHEPHLKAAYAPIIIESFNPLYDDDGVRYNDDAAIVAMLAECPHCLAAHNAIQERKVARRKLGAARRTVTMIGRTTAKEAV